MTSVEPSLVQIETEHLEIGRNDPQEDVRVTIVTHPYLDDTLESIRLEHFPWEDYVSTGLITQDEVAMIKHVENKSNEEVSSIMSEHGLYYAALYMELMNKLARVDALQKVLVLIHDMLEDHEERIELFHQASTKEEDFPFQPFLKAIRVSNEFIGIQASKVLTLLICSRTTADRHLDIQELFRWMTFQLQSSQKHVVDLNVQILGSLFHIPAYRKEFWNTNHAIDSLVNVFKISKNDGPQEIYEVTFAVWLLTFDKEIAVQLDRKYKIIPTLVELAKTAVKEKVTRIVVAIFKNLIERAPAENMQAMLVAKLLPLTEHLVTRKWSDEEISEDLEYIKGELQQNFQSLTTFEVYTSELDTGMLQWSPSHLSENFWKQNAGRLNDNNQNLLRKLARLLSASTNPVVLAVACHDMGQYVKYNPIDGRKNLELLGAKQRIMELMTHQDPDVKYNALSATQKYFYMAS